MSEKAFGILAKRFQVLDRKIHLDADKCTTVVNACIVLHNYLMTQHDAQYTRTCHASTAPLQTVTDILFSVIQEAWELEREGVTLELKEVGQVTLAGDSRCDTPGHNAKYGSYSLMDVDGQWRRATNRIVSMELVQVLQAGSAFLERMQIVHTCHILQHLVVVLGAEFQLHGACGDAALPAPGPGC